MKVAVTSDLHLPATRAEVILDLAGDIAAFEPQVLVVAGDIGESPSHIERCLSLLKEIVECPILVVAGNHDLWGREARSIRLWEVLVPETVRRTGCIWLEGDAWVREGVAVAGTIAWYDYSAADPAVQAAPEVFAREKRHFNVDGVLIDWPWTDPQFAAHVAEPFLATLDRLEADPAVRQTIVVTHVPLLECQMCRRPHDRHWGFSNAYFGNLTLGRQVLARRKVTHIVSGHTHVGRQAVLRLDDGRTVEAHVLASDYGRPVWLPLTLRLPTPEPGGAPA